MEELIKVNEQTMTVSARELHEKVGSTERFSTWFERQLQYGFVESVDYVGCKVFNTLAHQELQDYNCSVDMAKEICMVQRNEKARAIRTYLIDLEKAWNTPEQVMARALKIADQTIASLNAKVAMMQNKADYFDSLVDRNLLTNFRDTAKELGVKQKVFITYLEIHGYLYRDSHGNLRPYAEKNNGLFELKEFANGEFTGVQTLVTPRGRETFRLLLQVDKQEEE